MSNFFSVVKDKLSNTSYQNDIKNISNADVGDDNLIINLLSKFILPILFIFGFYIHSHGDYTPGGGFQSGVIFACAICLYYFINLQKKIKRISNLLLSFFSLIGFILYIGIGIVSIFITGRFLDFTFLPFLHNNARGVFIVELGIAFVVFSSVLRIFTTLLNLLRDIE